MHYKKRHWILANRLSRTNRIIQHLVKATYFAVGCISLFTLGTLKAQLPTTLKLLKAESQPVITTDNLDVLSSHNKSGFETGQVIKIGNEYHMFISQHTLA